MYIQNVWNSVNVKKFYKSKKESVKNIDNSQWHFQWFMRREALETLFLFEKFSISEKMAWKHVKKYYLSISK